MTDTSEEFRSCLAALEFVKPNACQITTKKKTSTDEEKEKDSEEAPEIKMEITNNIILEVLENIKSMLGTSVGPETPGNVPETSKSNDTSLRRSKRMSSISATDKVKKDLTQEISPICQDFAILFIC